MAEQGEEMLTIDQACAALGVSRATIFRMMDRGELTSPARKPYTKRASRLTFRRSDIERLLGRPLDAGTSEDATGRA